jgi:hypothetical protein
VKKAPNLAYWSGVFDAALGTKVSKRHYNNADYAKGRKRPKVQNLNVPANIRGQLLPVARALRTLV